MSLVGFNRIGFIHYRRLDPRRFRLHDLRASHLKPFLCDKGVERHVLRLKRRRPVAILPENAAESGRRSGSFQPSDIVPCIMMRIAIAYSNLKKSPCLK